MIDTISHFCLDSWIYTTMFCLCPGKAVVLASMNVLLPRLPLLRGREFASETSAGRFLLPECGWAIPLQSVLVIVPKYSCEPLLELLAATGPPSRTV